MSNPTYSKALSQAQSQSQSQPNMTESLAYRGVTGMLDDACTADGTVKPQWDYLLGSLLFLSKKEG